MDASKQDVLYVHKFVSHFTIYLLLRSERLSDDQAQTCNM